LGRVACTIGPLNDQPESPQILVIAQVQAHAMSLNIETIGSITLICGYNKILGRASCL
jgi:hypothetical protein